MTTVARFYAKIGILISWRTHQVNYREAKWYEMGAPVGEPGIPLAAGTKPPGTLTAVQKELTEMSSIKFGAIPAGGTDADSKLSQEQVAYYREHFPRVPSIFFVNSINVPGAGEQPGVTPGQFGYQIAFIRANSDRGWPQYDWVVAKEIARILGVTNNNLSGLVSDARLPTMVESIAGYRQEHLDPEGYKNPSNPTSYLRRNEIDTILKSYRLQPIQPDPTPSQ